MPDSKPMDSKGCAGDPDARIEISAHQSGECTKFVHAPTFLATLAWALPQG